ncbi:MAG TPA: GNAT family N-acetyltransferase [Candidatus Dormibacteraeota bacterium]|nr:GNAT family N-acetyltransferase [Candidatus Dormibacteraeota bacterium]
MVEIEAGCDGRPGLATLERTDFALVGRMFERLSAMSIYRRFFSPISRPDILQRSVQQLDHVDREAVGAVVGGELVGMAQYARRPGEKRAQMAIVIVDGWQRQGLGTRMVAALAQRALEHGIDSFAVDIQGDNYGGLKLFHRVAPQARITYSAGVGEGVIPLS